jgi:hypothetical protein
VALFVLVYLAGVLTIVSPCILPVVPFARTGRPFTTNALPLLVGMALTFAVVAALASAGGSWAVQANEVGRVVAMVLLAVFGVSLLVPEVSTQLARPAVALGARLSRSADLYAPGTPRLNEWGLSGNWTVTPESATLNAANGGITYRFHARDLHLVLGPATGSGPIHFRVTIDGAPPGPDHGVDVAEDGTGIVTDQRLYQMVRETGSVADHLFEIEFLDPGVQAYSFTFG